LEVLDLAFVVARKKPLALSVAALAGIAPFAALNFWLMTDPEFPRALLVFLYILEVPWATAPLTLVLGGLMFGQQPSAWRVTKTLLRAFFPMVIFHVVIRGFLMLSIVVYPLVPARLAFLDEVLLLERGEWWKVLGRCWNLCARRGGDLFIQWIIQLLFGTLFVFAFWSGTRAFLEGMIETDVTWEPKWSDTLGIRFHIAIWLAIAFFAIARFLSYIDQRIRLEGWEVSLRLRAAALALEENRTW
jgi:hypothetical protein